MLGQCWGHHRRRPRKNRSRVPRPLASTEFLSSVLPELLLDFLYEIAISDRFCIFLSYLVQVLPGDIGKI